MSETMSMSEHVFAFKQKPWKFPGENLVTFFSPLLLLQLFSSTLFSWAVSVCIGFVRDGYHHLAVCEYLKIRSINGTNSHFP